MLLILFLDREGKNDSKLIGAENLDLGVTSLDDPTLDCVE